MWFIITMICYGEAHVQSFTQTHNTARHFIAAMGVMLLSERASWYQFIGLLIAFVGMALIQWIKKPA